MSGQIKESDWKLLRQLHPVALDRFCQRVLSEIASINADSTKSCHQRYLAIYKVIERRDREIARTFNDLRRSTALAQLAAMRSHGLLTQDEFVGFSQETQSVAEALSKM